MFVIARHSKIKSTGELRASLKHNCREQPTPNADASKTPLNGGDNVTVDGAMGKYRKLLGDHKARKNAVHAVEYMFSASPEWFKDKDRTQVIEYLRDCTNYVRDKFTAQNVISVRYHFDETTPHAHVVVVPMLEGKLNAKHYLGGSRAVAQAFQADIGKLGQRHGLERGQEGSTATHTEVQEFYKIVNEIGSSPEEALKLINRGKLKEQNEENIGKVRKDSAKIVAEANKRAGQYHASKNTAENALAETKSLLKQTKADHAKALKDATMSHDKEVKKLRSEIDKLNKQVVDLTNDRNRWKTRAKKADENAEKLWLEKNAKYIENIEKDRHANLKNKIENSETKSLLQEKEKELEKAQDNVKRMLGKIYGRAVEAITESVTMSRDTVHLPDGLASDQRFKDDFADMLEMHSLRIAATTVKTLQKDAQGDPEPDPLPTPTPDPEKRVKRKSGPSMG